MKFMHRRNISHGRIMMLQGIVQIDVYKRQVMLDLQSGNTHSYISYLKDIVDEECDQSVRAGVLIERLKVYEPEFPKNLEPMVYVNSVSYTHLDQSSCTPFSGYQQKPGGAAIIFGLAGCRAGSLDRFSGSRCNCPSL